MMMLFYNVQKISKLVYDNMIEETDDFPMLLYI